jgi:hypothetical protein
LKIDGGHPYKKAIPDGHVAYTARRLPDAEVAYFNYALAKEMGLIPRRHPECMDARLRGAILDTFSLRIINEYDLERKTRFPPRDVLPNTYMATRYLALQHPGRTGRTSGDGRSVWNGSLTHRGVTWDLSSCGTGVTRLCPATAEQERYFKTGNWASDYGCGTATVQEGFVAALMSETFRRNGIATERVLAVVELADGFAINVRAGHNLLRPSHFFVHLKQNNLASLRAVADCFIDRQVSNGLFREPNRANRGGDERYRLLAEEMARTFARVAATFESEYIFCWLDWDGDNILADGGIIDYGSVRQFGLYHREYRFDDGPRWSTTIPEQKKKARYIAQGFAQIRDFLITGSKPPLKSLSNDPALDLFDEESEKTKKRLLLRNVGFGSSAQERLTRWSLPALRRFQRAHAYFEHARSARGPHEVEDGISWNAIFSMRDFLRELPLRYLETGGPLPTSDFLEIGLSGYATKDDRRETAHRCRMAKRFQQAYLELIESAAKRTDRSVPLLLGDIAARSAILNRHDRITGDGALHAVSKLVRNRKRLGPDGVYRVLECFADQQTRIPENKSAWGIAGQVVPDGEPDVEKIFDGMMELVAEHRHGL